MISKFIGGNRSPEEYSVGIWGTPRAGKTTYLAMLYHMTEEYGYRMRPLNDESRDFLMHVYSRLVDDRTFPNPNDDISEYDFGLQMPGLLAGLGRQEIRLSFLDAPGEAFEDPENPKILEREGVEKILQFLASSKRLICLIDPERGETSSYFNPLLHLLYPLDQRDETAGLMDFITQRVAFVLTKIDLYDDRWEARHDPVKLAQKTLKKSSLRLIREYCAPRQHNFFACSSVGRITDPETGKEIPNVEVERDSEGRVLKIHRIIDSDNMQPYGIFEVTAQPGSAG